MKPSISRRRVLTGTLGAAGAALTAAPLAASRLLTPTQSAGPFYPLAYPADGDNDLTRVAGASAPARGTHVLLRGRVLERPETPIERAHVEIWQCDANGRYHHPRDSSAAALDPGFQGWGRFVTGADGGYWFRTILPVPYPGRTPHIHFRIRAGARALTTQMYLADAPGNRRDRLFNSVPERARDSLVVHFATGAEGLPEGRFDIILG